MKNFPNFSKGKNGKCVEDKTYRTGSRALRLIQGGIKAINEDSGLMKFFKASRKKVLAVIIGICIESIILLVRGVYK